MLSRDFAHRDTDAYARARILQCSIKVNKVNTNVIAATQQRAKSLILLRSVFV